MAKPNADEIAFPAEGHEVFTVSPNLILPSTWGQFAVYLKQGDSFVLYTSKGEVFSQERLDRLEEMGANRVYIRMEDKTYYQEYLQVHLSDILDNHDVPVAERAGALYQASVHHARRIFESRLPHLADEGLGPMEEIIEACTRFLANPDALKELAAFLAKGFSLYEHSLGVMILTVSVLRSAGREDEKLLLRCALGGLLHDVGKARLPEEILTTPERSLNLEDRKMLHSHPALGVSVLSTLSLSQETYNCILLHHERQDGAGYPTGTPGEKLPDYVQALAVCNRYDALTRSGSDRPAMPPFQALKTIRDDRGACSRAWLKRLIAVLAQAEVT